MNRDNGVVIGLVVIVAILIVIGILFPDLWRGDPTPVPIPSSVPKSTGTDTPMPTFTFTSTRITPSTATETSAFTSTPTLTPTSTNTTIPVTVYITETPLETPPVIVTPESTPGIETDILLLEPEDGAGCYHISQIRFRWQWSQMLSDEGPYGGEFFAFRVWKEDKSPHSIVWTKSTSFHLVTDEGPLELEPGAEYSWNVAVVRPYAEPRAENWLLVAESEDRSFTFCGVATSIPTPTPSRTPTSTSMPTATPTLEPTSPGPGPGPQPTRTPPDP